MSGSISNSQRFNACFLPPILLNQSEEDVHAAVRDHCLLTDLVRSMRNGNMTPEELLEASEAFMPDMDEYADFVEEQLETVERQWEL